MNCSKTIINAMLTEFPSPKYYVGFDSKFNNLIPIFINDRIQDYFFYMFIRMFEEESERKVHFKNEN
jgi:hypothetical protein